MTVGELRKALYEWPAKMPVVFSINPNHAGPQTVGIRTLREELANPRGCTGRRLVLCARIAATGKGKP